MLRYINGIVSYTLIDDVLGILLSEHSVFSVMYFKGCCVFR